MKIRYDSAETPPEYTCSECGKSGCKLWRPWQTMCPSLLCAACAAGKQKKDISSMGADGRCLDDAERWTDQIGWYVPAIPDEEGVGYWGYTAVPTEGVNWWQALPNG